MLSLWTKGQGGLVLAKIRKKHFLFTAESISCENFFSFSFKGRMLSLWTKGQGGPVLATMPLVLSFVTSNRNSFFVLLTSRQGTSSHYQESYCDLGFWYFSICQLNQYISTNIETAMLSTNFLHHGIWHSGGLSWTAHVCLVSSCLVLQQMKTAFLSLPLCQKFKTFLLSLGGRLYLVLSCLVLHQTKAAFPSLSLCLPVKSSNLQNLFCLDGGGLAGAF